MCATLFGLLAATGLRISEGLRLDDVTADGLIVRRTKFTFQLRGTTSSVSVRSSPGLASRNTHTLSVQGSEPVHGEGARGTVYERASDV
jgi:hypothetical protein